MGNLETNTNTQIMRGIIGMFPSRESFEQFEQEDAELANDAVPQIIRFAYARHLIPVESRDALLELLATSSGETHESQLDGKSFEDIIAAILTNAEKGTKLTVNGLVEKLNGLSKQFGLPNVQASMITRLKQRFDPSTPRKRAALRLLAYWAAENRPQLQWNYEKFLWTTRQLSDEHNLENPDEGVVIAFNIQGRGAIVEAKAVAWVKEGLQRCLSEFSYFKHISSDQIEASSVTSVNLKLPRKAGPSGEPHLYNQALRNSLALAHQLSVRWLLSEFCDPKRVLITAIFAGPFVEANLLLLPLLEARLAGDPDIMLTDFAYLCAKVADLKVVFKHPPTPYEVGRGHLINVWLVDYFWSLPYFDFIPALLAERMLPNDSQSAHQFRQELDLPGNLRQESFDALAAIHKFPQHTSLLMEIVKVLLARRLFHEANAIIAKILMLYPRHVLANMTRITIYTNIAIEHPHFPTSEMAFRRAIAQGEILTAYCQDEPDVWCTYGLAYYTRAEKYLRTIRHTGEQPALGITCAQVLNDLAQAVEKFGRGMMISPAAKDNRSFSLLAFTQSLLTLLTINPDLFDKDHYPILEDTHHIFRQIALRYFALLDWIECYDTTATDADLLARLSDAEIRRTVGLVSSGVGIAMYHNAVLLRTFRPNVFFSFASILWDFMPKLTVGVCRQVLTWLQKARDEAQLLQSMNLAIFSMARSFPQKADEFIRCIERTIETVTQLIPEEEWRQDDHVFLSDATQAKVASVKLLLLHLDRNTG